ncbi:MAG: L-tyrosine/L-tryptophan isonitrile synthase family protein [Candidatus Moranbacteria bacterium]|nr:L-tyrosine/L-tryptophan isonitrile synthase family protein [Candidatus Moranbacteria bacterium]
MNEITAQISGQLNTWKYKRAHPYKINEVEKIIAESVKAGLPIPLFGYWGVGNKADCNEAEANSVGYLNSLVQSINKIYSPGVQVTFILSDIHADNNCIPKDTIGEYIKKMQMMFRENNFKMILLSELYSKYGLSSESVLEDASINNKIWWQFFPLKKDLIKQANNVSLCSDKGLSAKCYAVMRKNESEILEKEFANQIFITYSAPHYRMLYPNLPTLYLYSEKKGCCTVPWFTYVDGDSVRINED